MMNKKEGFCWAAPLGGCDGPITPEHLVTRSLFGKRVVHRISNGPRDGGGPSEIRWGDLKAHILCQKHNSELGSTADWAALRLFAHLKAINNPMSLPGSRILRPPVDRRVSGVNFGRWLCKTHCDIMFASGKLPDAAYAFYAFARPLPRLVHFYYTGLEGQQLRLADDRYPRVSWTQLINDADPEADIFSISLAGFETMVSTKPYTMHGKQMVDRVKVLQQPTDLGMSRIVFGWTGEPPVAAIS